MVATPESLLLLKIAKAVKELKARQPEKGDPGRDPTADEIFTAISLWMEFHREEVRGEPGKSPKAVPGPAGVGIDDLSLEDDELVVVLTDGRKKRFKLPEIKDRRHSTAYLGAGGAASAPAAGTLKSVVAGSGIDVDNTDPANPIINAKGGGGGSLQELGDDPIDPANGDTWVLRSLNNAAGTLQAVVGGFPLVTEVDDFKYQFSFKTINEGIKRVELS